MNFMIINFHFTLEKLGFDVYDGTVGNSEKQQHWIQNLTLVGAAIMRYMTLAKAFKKITFTKKFSI